MSSSGIAFFEICAKPETALISDDPKAAFKEFNLISRIYLHAAPGPEDDQILRGTLRAACLSSNLVADWLRCYRQQCHSGVEDWCITKVGSTMRWMRSISLPFYLSPCLRCWTQILWLSANLRSERSSLLLLLLLYQRSLGARRQLQLTRYSRDGSKEVSRSVVDRPQVRAGLHNPKRLLDLVGSSTSALDQTKRFELLKGAGMNFKGTKSFSDKLNAAILQLDLGLGGYSRRIP